MLTGRHPHGIQSMRMEGPYPGSTYDPKQCPFWPALFRKNGYHTAQIGKWHTGTDAGFGRDWDYQIVWNRPKHPENAGAYYEQQILAFNGEEKWQDGYPADNYTKWAVEYVKGAQPRQGQAVVPLALLRQHPRPVQARGPAQGAVQGREGARAGRHLGPWPGKPDYLEEHARLAQGHGRRSLSPARAARRSATRPATRTDRLRRLGAAGERVRAGHRRGRRRV